MPEPLYTPSGLIDIYNNALRIEQETKVITVVGVYKKGTNQLYANRFYDSLVDENGSEKKIVIKTNQLQRNMLIENMVATVLGVLNRKIRDDSTIAVSLNVTEVVSVNETRFSEDEIKRADIITKKLNIGYKAPENIIKQKLYKNEKINVALIFATSTVVTTEFYNALSYANNYLNITERVIAFSNSENVLILIANMSRSNDIVALIRGGGMGAGLEFFNSIAFNEKVIEIRTCLISAIGHNEEQLFFKKIADKTVDTPTALGTFFKNLVDEVMEDINNSKAILTEQVKQQLQGEIKLINEQNEKLNTQLKQVIDNNNKLSEDTTKRLREINDLNIKIANSQNIENRLSNTQKDLDKKKMELSKAILLIIVLIIALAYVLLN